MKLYLLNLIMLFTKHSLRIMLIQVVSVQLVLASEMLGQPLSKVEVTITVSDASLGELIEMVENQTDFVFTSSGQIEESDTRVDLNLHNANLKQVLKEFSQAFQYNFKRVNKNIYVWKPEKGKKHSETSAKIPVFDRLISGKVTDENDQGLPGVNVLVKDTEIGTITDVNGDFRLNIPDEATTLVFSYIGYITEEVATAGRDVIDYQLLPDVETLSEVVVIGYGTTTKRKLVGAVSSLETKTLEQTPFANVTQALQGQVPGLIVQSSGGGLNKVPDISIRGAGKPLFVIDGVVIDENDDYSFASLNMEDIESINFLKDASSTAVYGSRAGNGIVLVETKRGQAGKLNLQYSFNYQLSRPTVLPDRINTYEFVQVQNDAAIYDGLEPFYTAEQLNIIRSGSDPDTYPNTDWQELSLKEFAPEQKHNISLSGGNDITDFYVSLGYFDQEGILKSDAISLQRMNIRSNVTTRIERIGLQLGFNVNASLQNSRQPALGEWAIWNHMARAIPLYKAFNDDGTYAEGVNHPLAQNDFDAGYLKERQKFVNTQIQANWEVPNVNGLSMGLMANYRDGDNYIKRWELLAPQYQSDGTVYPVSKPQLDVESGFENKLDFIYNLSYARNFGNHGLDVTLAYNRIRSEGERVGAFRREFLSGAVDQIFAGPALGQSTSGNAYNTANEGYVGRFKYDFASRYILEFSFRYDGNDNFAPSKRWGFFPAVAAAWIVSDEAFMQPLYEKNIISSLKLRASYGTTGLTDGVIRHGYLPVYNLEPNAYNIGNNLVNGFSEGPLVNAEALTWFTRESLDYGVDFGFFRNKITGSFDYFYYKTSGYLQSPDVEYSATLGKDLPQISSNSVQRRAGFEFSINHTNRINDFRYTIGLNFSRFNQLWEQLDTEDEVTLKNPYTRITHETDFYRRTGSSDGGLYVSDGFYQSEEQILNTPRPLASSETQLGDIVYSDVNGDGKIDEQDRRRIGLPTFPRTTFGFTFDLGYKGWSLSGLIQGTGDRYTALGRGYQKGEAVSTTLDFQLDYWSPTNTDAFFPRVTHISGVNGGNNLLDSDYFILNARYVRLKTLRLGYDLKRSMLNRANFIQSCNVFVSGINILTFSGVTDYFDPEDVINQDNSINGFSGAAYPMQQTFAVGLNVSF